MKHTTATTRCEKRSNEKNNLERKQIRTQLFKCQRQYYLRRSSPEKSTLHFLRSRHYNFTWRGIIQMIYKLTDLPTMVCGRSSSGIRSYGWASGGSITSSTKVCVFVKNATRLLRLSFACHFGSWQSPYPCIFKRQSFTWFAIQIKLYTGSRNRMSRVVLSWITWLYKSQPLYYYTIWT